jgi:hypothetical protein
LKLTNQDHSDSDDDASDEQDEEDEEEYDDDIASRVHVRAYGFRAKYPLTSMPAERPDHKFFQAKYSKTVSHHGQD